MNQFDIPCMMHENPLEIPVSIIICMKCTDEGAWAVLAGGGRGAAAPPPRALALPPPPAAPPVIVHAAIKSPSMANICPPPHALPLAPPQCPPRRKSLAPPIGGSDVELGVR